MANIFEKWILNKKIIIFGGISAIFGISIGYFIYKKSKIQKTNKFLKSDKFCEIIKEITEINTRKINKKQTAILAGIIMGFSKINSQNEISEKIKNRVNKISELSNYEYIQKILDVVNIQHFEYNKILSEICKYFNLNEKLLVNSMEFYIEDYEYNEIQTKITYKILSNHIQISKSEVYKIYENFKKLCEKVFCDINLYQQAEKVALVKNINPAGFGELILKTKVYDLLYKEYGFSQEEIENLFRIYNLHT